MSKPLVTKDAQNTSRSTTRHCFRAVFVANIQHQVTLVWTNLIASTKHVMDVHWAKATVHSCIVPKTVPWLIVIIRQMMKFRNMDKYHLSELVRLGIVSDESSFEMYCSNHNLEFYVAQIKAVGYKGRKELVSVNSSELFECCNCGEPCVMAADKCGVLCSHEVCYNCAGGRPPFKHCAKRCTIYDCDHSTIDDWLIFYLLMSSNALVLLFHFILMRTLLKIQIRRNVYCKACMTLLVSLTCLSNFANAGRSNTYAFDDLPSLT